MPRAERLFDLLQILRRHRQPVSGASLAGELGVSLRTLYRDIAALQRLGAEVDGEPGVGYVLRPGFLLPPLMFAEEEMEAVMLGIRWVAERGDPRLAAAACDARARIGAVLPAELRDRIGTPSLLIGPESAGSADTVDLALLRDALRRERKLALVYRDQSGAETERTVWPVALGFFDRMRMLVAWCELRDGFRHFRTDRMVSATVTDQRPPRRRAALLTAWRESEGIRCMDC